MGNSSISRRRFLQISAALLGAAGTALPAFTTEDETILIPPSIMLHGRWRHRDLLPGFLDALLADGYTGITYQDFSAAIFEGTSLPEKPILISLDDITMMRGGTSYEMFVEMVETFISREFRATLAVVTRPQDAQDEERWAQVTGWTEQGIELATHTAHHVNLTSTEMSQEIVNDEVYGSALMIAEATGKPVTTLILPFGNGYDRNTSAIHPFLIEPCHQAGINALVGIVGGRTPIHPREFAPDRLLTLGRVAPGLKDQEYVDSALWEVEHWIST